MPASAHKRRKTATMAVGALLLATFATSFSAAPMTAAIAPAAAAEPDDQPITPPPESSYDPGAPPLLDPPFDPSTNAPDPALTPAPDEATPTPEPVWLDDETA